MALRVLHDFPRCYFAIRFRCRRLRFQGMDCVPRIVRTCCKNPQGKAVMVNGNNDTPVRTRGRPRTKPKAVRLEIWQQKVTANYIRIRKFRLEQLRDRMTQFRGKGAEIWAENTIEYYNHAIRCCEWLLTEIAKPVGYADPKTGELLP